MASVNKVILVGTLGRDPEMRTFPTGGQIANVAIATNEKWRDKATGENRELTEWHRVVFSGKLAEIAGKYLRKGSQVYVEGSLRTRKWTDQESGQERYATEIRVDQLQMLGSKPGSAGNVSAGDAPRPAAPQHAPATAAAPAAAPIPAPAVNTSSAGFDAEALDEDIPF